MLNQLASFINTSLERRTIGPGPLFPGGDNVVLPDDWLAKLLALTFSAYPACFCRDK
jgi:hypothetical protein